jgi:hypothetical protein
MVTAAVGSVSRVTVIVTVPKDSVVNWLSGVRMTKCLPETAPELEEEMTPELAVPLLGASPLVAVPPLVAAPLVAVPLLGIVPLLGGVSPLLGGVSPLLGGVSPLLGGVSPLLGGVSPLLGGVSPLLGGVSPLEAVPLLGGVSPLLGGVSPLEAVPLLGGVSPLLGGVSPLEAVPLLGNSPLLGGVSPLEAVPLLGGVSPLEAVPLLDTTTPLDAPPSDEDGRAWHAPSTHSSPSPHSSLDVQSDDGLGGQASAPRDRVKTPNTNQLFFFVFPMDSSRCLRCHRRISRPAVVPALFVLHPRKLAHLCALVHDAQKGSTIAGAPVRVNPNLTVSPGNPPPGVIPVSFRSRL